MDTATLVTRAVAGDVDAFTELVKRYERMAFTYALATLGDYHMAEDATQQALLTAYRNLATLRDEKRFGGWLRGIVRFECLRALRERTRHRTESIDSSSAMQIADVNADVEHKAETNGAFEHVLAVMSRLPERQRVVAEMYYLADRSQAEVASFLGLSIATVNNRLREARRSIRMQGAFPMDNQSFNTPPFASSIGTVIRAEGAILDANLNQEHRPPLLTAVTVGEHEAAIAAYIAQYLDDDLVRLIATDEVRADLASVKGTSVHIRESTTDVQLPADAIAALGKGEHESGELRSVPSGIKVIDVFAPLIEGGVVALVGEKNVGKMVVVQELCSRLKGLSKETMIVVFLQSPDELGVIRGLDLRVDHSVSTMLVPVADASLAALGASLSGFDAVLVMSGELAREGRYPAIDPLSSRSRFVRETDVVDRARELLRDNPQDHRARLLRAYLTQAFYVAEEFSGRPGVTVSPDIAVADIVRILEGDVSGMEPEALVMVGPLPT